MGNLHDDTFLHNSSHDCSPIDINPKRNELLTKRTYQGSTTRYVYNAANSVGTTTYTYDVLYCLTAVNRPDTANNEAYTLGALPPNFERPLLYYTANTNLERYFRGSSIDELVAGWLQEQPEPIEVYREGGRRNWALLLSRTIL